MNNGVAPTKPHYNAGMIEVRLFNGKSAWLKQDEITAIASSDHSPDCIEVWCHGTRFDVEGSANAFMERFNARHVENDRA